MALEYRVNVYLSEEDSDVISRVRYNANLDYWDGRNHSNGGTGKHKGLTKLKDGTYVLIHGTNWQGEKDYAITVSDEEALNEILKSGNIELLKMKKFKTLKDLYETSMIKEDLDDELEEEL